MMTIYRKELKFSDHFVSFLIMVFAQCFAGYLSITYGNDNIGQIIVVHLSLFIFWPMWIHAYKMVTEQ